MEPAMCQGSASTRAAVAAMCAGFVDLDVAGPAGSIVRVRDWGFSANRYTASLFGPPNGPAFLAFISGNDMRVVVNSGSEASLWIDHAYVSLGSIADGERIAATFNVDIRRAAPHTAEVA